MKLIFTSILFFLAYQGIGQEHLVAQVPGSNLFVSSESDSDNQHFAILRVYAKKGSSYETTFLHLSEAGEMTPVKPVLNQGVGTTDFFSIVDSVSQSYILQVGSWSCNSFMFNKERENRRLHVDCQKDKILRFHNSRLFLAQNDSLKVIDTRNFNFALTAYAEIAPSYEVVEVKDSVVFFRSNRDSTLLLKNFRNEVVSFFKLNDPSKSKIFPAAAGIFYTEKFNNLDSVWLFQNNGTRIFVGSSPRLVGANHSLVVLSFNADSLVLKKEGRRQIISVHGDAKSLFHQIKQPWPRFTGSPGILIVNDSIGLCVKANFLVDTVIDGKIQSSAYLVNLNSGKVTNTFQSGMSYFLSGFGRANFKGRIFTVAPTAYYGEQVIELDTKTGRVIIRTKFVDEPCSLKILPVGNQLYCLRSKPGSEVHELWKVDTEHEYPETAGHWANSVFSLSQLNNQIGSRASATHADQHGNIYTLAMTAKEGVVYAVNNKENKIEMVHKSPISNVSSSGYMFLQKFNKDGKNVWSAQFEGNQNPFWFPTIPYNIKTDKSGSVYLAGTANQFLKIGQFEFGGMSWGNRLGSLGYIAKFDSNGRFLDLFPKRIEANTTLTAFDIDDVKNMYCAIVAPDQYEFQDRIIVPQTSIPFFTIHKMDSTGRLVWTSEINLFGSGFKFIPRVEKMMWDRSLNRLYVLINGLPGNSFYRPDGDTKLLSKVVCINPENGSAIWSRIFSSTEELRMFDFAISPFQTINIFGVFKNEIHTEGKRILKNNQPGAKGFWVRLNMATGAYIHSTVFSRSDAMPLHASMDPSGNVFLASASLNFLARNNTTSQNVYYDSYDVGGNLMGTYSYSKWLPENRTYFHNVAALVSYVSDRKVLVGDHGTGIFGEGFNFGHPTIYSKSNAVFYLLDFEKLPKAFSPFEELENKLLIYPNPSDGWFFMLAEQFKELTECHLQLYSTDGRKIFSENIPIHSGQAAFDGRYLKAGMYVGILSTNSGFSKTIRIVKK